MITPEFEEDVQLGIYGVLLEILRDKAASLGGRLTPEHSIHTRVERDPETGEEFVIRHLIWKMVEL
jgi:hypothetical protein